MQLRPIKIGLLPELPQGSGMNVLPRVVEKPARQPEVRRVGLFPSPARRGQTRAAYLRATGWS